MKKILFTICFMAFLTINAQLTFTSAAAGDWTAPAIWTVTDPGASAATNTVPTAVDEVFIGHIVKIKVAGQIANNVTITGTGNYLQINGGRSLNVTNNLVFSNFNELRFAAATNKNMGTLIVGGTVPNVTLNVSYRLPNNNKWHLISAPLKQAKLTDYESLSKTIVRNAALTKSSLATYDDTNAIGAKYDYLANPFGTGTEKFVQGEGYSTKLNNTGDITKPDAQFKGKLNNGNIFTAMPISATSDYILVGNPYTAFLYGNTAAHATNNVIALNSSNLEENTIWLWDGTNETWVTKNLGDAAAFNIAPVQGFFVKAKILAAATNFKFQPALQTHGSGNTFLKSANTRFEIDLSIATTDVVRKTSIRYVNNTTTKFDNGYDSSMFGGYSSKFAVYTELVENNSGKKLAIQSLPNANFENMVIPVGVNATANSEITFSADALNVPSGYNVYLEDRTNSTMTRLDKANAEYKTTVIEASTNGRFFLHTRTSSVLSLDTELLNGISIYKTSNSNLKISGLQKGKTTVSLYNILGKQVMNTSFEGSNVNNISLPKLATGVYIVKLEAEQGTLNKTIILE